MSAHIHPRPIYLSRAGFSSKIGDTTLFLELHETLGTGQRKTKKFVPPTEPMGRMSHTGSGSSKNFFVRESETASPSFFSLCVFPLRNFLQAKIFFLFFCP